MYKCSSGFSYTYLWFITTLCSKIRVFELSTIPLLRLYFVRHRVLFFILIFLFRFNRFILCIKRITLCVYSFISCIERILFCIERILLCVYSFILCIERILLCIGNFILCIERILFCYGKILKHYAISIFFT